MTKPVLGCIADDFTGATDLANNLVREGMRVVQTIGVPDSEIDIDADAIVVALKSRTVPAETAVTESLNAARWLQSLGTKQLYFKYCSTFDSTPSGNIGPVTEALMDLLETEFTIACPAFPENGRTVFKGYLFVGDVLLHESGMKNHPLTPMNDSNLVRVMQTQCKRKVGLIDHTVLAHGASAVEQAILKLKQDGVSIAVVDATSHQDLLTMAPALSKLPLITAGSGVAIGLPRNFGLEPQVLSSQLPNAVGFRAIVSGSCSIATNAQVASFLSHGGEAFAIDPLQLIGGEQVVIDKALDWAKSKIEKSPVLIYATAEPAQVKAVQAHLGIEASGELVERALSTIARELVKIGVGQLIVAGGETSGACVKALEINQMRIGPQIAPGVPWCHANSKFAPESGLHLTLKSGNFGAPNFFTSAFEML